MSELDDARRRERDRDLERRQHLASVPAGAVDEQVDRFRGRLRALGLEASPGQLGNGVVVERLEAEQRAAAAQRRVDLEERVLGRGTDERQRAVLDGREEGVLLRLREPVDLVEEQDRAAAVLAEPLPGALDARRARP